jgi:hypothetical protein
VRRIPLDAELDAETPADATPLKSVFALSEALRGSPLPLLSAVQAALAPLPAQGALFEGGGGGEGAREGLDGAAAGGGEGVAGVDGIGAGVAAELTAALARTPARPHRASSRSLSPGAATGTSAHHPHHPHDGAAPSRLARAAQWVTSHIPLPNPFRRRRASSAAPALDALPPYTSGAEMVATPQPMRAMAAALAAGGGDATPSGAQGAQGAPGAGAPAPGATARPSLDLPPLPLAAPHSAEPSPSSAPLTTTGTAVTHASITLIFSQMKDLLLGRGEEREGGRRRVVREAIDELVAAHTLSAR